MAPTHGSYFHRQSATASASAEHACLEEEDSLEPEVSAKSMSNLTSASGEASFSSDSKFDCHPITDVQQHQSSSIRDSCAAGTSTQEPGKKRKRNLPGNPDPEAEVIALSPRTLMTTNRFVCEICGKGFQRDQNLQLHRRGHNLPWKLRQRSCKEVKKRVYICPEQSCVHHDPSRALGDLTGIKKHFCRKHGEKKWKCDKCSKRYAVQSDWKAHGKTCGTREYRCHCGTLFSRRDSFITHRAFCDALAEETAKISFLKAAPIQPYAGQETSCFGSAPVAISRASSSLYSIVPHSLSIPNFFGMALPPCNIAIPPPSSRTGLDISSIRQGASSSENFDVVQLRSNFPTNLVASFPRIVPMSILPNSGVREDRGDITGLSGSCEMLQFNRLTQSDRLMEAEPQTYNTLLENEFQDAIRQTQKQNFSNFGKQHHYCQSSFSINHDSGADDQEKLVMGSLFSSIGPSFGRASKTPSAVQGQKFSIVEAADFEPSNARIHQERTSRASPVAGRYLASSAGVVGNLVSGSAHDTTNGLSISTSSIHRNPQAPRSQMSATALLQKAAQMGAIFSDSSRKQYCQDFMGTESIPSTLRSLASKSPGCQRDPTTSLSNLDHNSVHSILTQKLTKLASEPLPNQTMDHGMLKTDRSMPIGKSSMFDVPDYQCQQPEAISLSCQARVRSSLPFSIGISDNKYKSINDANMMQNLAYRNVVFGFPTPTGAENIPHGGEEIYGSVSCTHAPLPGLEGNIGSNLREQLIHERATRDFLGVDVDRADGLRPAADIASGVIVTPLSAAYL